MGKKKNKKAKQDLEEASMRGHHVPAGRIRVADKNNIPNDKKWKRDSEVLCAEHDEVLRLRKAGKEQEANRSYRKIIVLATNLLDDIQAEIDAIFSGLNDGESNMWCAIRPQVQAYHLRSVAFLNLGRSQECIDDCTAALKCRLGTRNLLDGARGSWFHICFLMKRGCALRGLGWLEDSVADYRAAVAAFHVRQEQGEPSWEEWPTIADAREKLFFPTCHLKVLSGNPLFTHKERESLFKQVGYANYCKENLKCHECGVSTGLKLCEGCRHAWFCSRKCLKKAWKGDHKQICKAPKVHIFVEDKQAALREIADHGFINSGSLDDYPVIVTRDSSTGRLFDILRNDVAVFAEFVTDSNGDLGLSMEILPLPCNIAHTTMILHNRSRCPDLQKKIDAFIKSSLVARI